MIGSAPVVMRIVFMRKFTLFLEQKSLLKDYSVTTKNRPNFCCLIVNFIEKPEYRSTGFVPLSYTMLDNTKLNFFFK